MVDTVVPHPLGIVRHVVPGSFDTAVAGVPVVHLPVATEASYGFDEVWTTGRPVQVEQVGDVIVGHEGEYAFAAVHVPAADEYAVAVRDSYLELLNAVIGLGYPEVFRIWNTVGRINEPNENGLEIYRDFCLGRAEAFDKLGTTLPAGTGVGSPVAGITVHLLSRRTRGQVAIENRRQVPAYEYPRQYGPRSPSFARATRLPETGQLFVSGTAGILGHATVHRDDLLGQIRVTAENLEVLTGDLQALTYVKVYVRSEHDLPTVRRECQRLFAPEASVVYVVTDLCRAELLVEIEGVAVG
ncbi:reactive intermediate/imine deaminase [Kribbella antibiotica]|uniref:Reactive intermediate/imine deaminase n=1 Tax=Kribbella antibiotica TaxID=190195 RepID=A0A4R4ZRK2_9ACTN|nr:reactive intermediate/imine deaminase [Kribbella antibiotica]TDD61613.1 reactive intermediate/imine deaminase [Kribbella antibiotica]